MKLNSLTILLVLGLMLSVGATGCRKRPTSLTDIPNKPYSGPETPEGTGPLQPGPYDMAGATNVSTLIPLNDPQLHANWIANTEIFKEYTVHFDYDSSAIKSGERSKVGSVADYLKGNAQTALRVDGHCDERGTEEYNRSLGERRALALREELIKLGIDPTRVDTKSLGEDQPVNPVHNEQAWRQNRRGEFILLTPP